MDSIREAPTPNVSIAVADAGLTKAGKVREIEGNGYPNRSRLKITIEGAGALYLTPAQADALYQALGNTLEPLERP